MFGFWGDPGVGGGTPSCQGGNQEFGGGPGVWGGPRCLRGDPDIRGGGGTLKSSGRDPEEFWGGPRILGGDQGGLWGGGVCLGSEETQALPPPVPDAPRAGGAGLHPLRGGAAGGVGQVQRAGPRPAPCSTGELGHRTRPYRGCMGLGVRMWGWEGGVIGSIWGGERVSRIYVGSQRGLYGAGEGLYGPGRGLIGSIGGWGGAIWPWGGCVWSFWSCGGVIGSRWGWGGAYMGWGKMYKV